MVLYNNIEKLYIKNTECYSIIDKKQEEIMINWKDEFDSICRRMNKKNDSKRLFNFKGDLPYGYVIPKNKDLNKCRPVVSYYKHP